MASYQHLSLQPIHTLTYTHTHTECCPPGKCTYHLPLLPIFPFSHSPEAPPGHHFLAQKHFPAPDCNSIFILAISVSVSEFRFLFWFRARNYRVTFSGICADYTHAFTPFYTPITPTTPPLRLIQPVEFARCPLAGTWRNVMKNK